MFPQIDHFQAGLCTVRNGWLFLSFLLGHSGLGNGALLGVNFNVPPKSSPIFRWVRGSITITARLCKRPAGSMKRPNNFTPLYDLIPFTQRPTSIWPRF